MSLNSNLGDARATESVRHGEINLGQIMRERYGDEVYAVGITTFTGTVMAAFDWGARIRGNIPATYPSAI